MTFDSPGSITLTGSYSPGYQLALGAEATFINAGTFTGAIAFAGSKTTPVAIDNLVGATMNLTSVTASNQNMEIGTLSNAGTLNFNGYPGYATIGIRLNNSGQVMIGSGETVSLKGGGTLDGTFTGAGTLDLYTDKYSSTPAALSGIAAVDIGKGALLNLNGSGSTVGISNITSNPGHIVATGGSLTFLGGFQNTGNIDAAGYSISFDNGVGGKGVMEVGSGGTLSLLAGSSSQQTVEFLSSNAQLALTNPLEFSGVLTDFGTGDTIDLVQQAATGFSFTNNVLTVVDGSTTVATLSFNGGYGDNSFAITPDGHGGSTISFV